MGEKFAAQPATGTANLSVPLALSPGRSGFAPQLALAYDSGAGNGPFGIGWSLGLPAITRKTDKGLPRYLDGEESDVFLLAGAEDLVPVLDAAGQRLRTPRTVHGVAYQVHPYRPRVEGPHARIERWVAVATGDTHWRGISRDNVTSLYGLDAESRIAGPPAPGHPERPRQAFSWLLCRSFDDRGNAIRYRYQAEDDRGVDRAQAHEANRDATARTAQRYLKRILYGNTQPYFPSAAADGDETPLPAAWRFEVVLDYGDHAADAPASAPDRDWRVRPDPFSSYRAGFEVRTYRRCQRILLFHHFPEVDAVGADSLVRSTDLRYSDEAAPADPRNPIYTFPLAITQAGYRRQGAGYLRRSLPPLELEYTQPQVHPQVLGLDADSLANLPEGLDGARYQWVDLDGEGLSGLLTDLDGGWGYMRNLSPLARTPLPDGGIATRARFAPLAPLATLPAGRELGGRTQLLDLSGAGRLDAVALDDPAPGFFERTPDRGWQPFRSFASLPRRDWSEPNLKFVDLTGDGLADVLLTEDGLFTFYPSLGQDGYGEAELARTPWDEERGPRVVLADGSQTVFLADLSGDGLADLVRIRNGEVCYWPNLGYGRFGARVTMDGAPRFADEERFDPRRLRLADVDGSGTADLLYVGEDGVQVCFNRSGNSWAEPHRLAVFPTADALSAVQVVDLLGTGTACLVWSSPLPAHARAPLLYVDLMGGDKPHLLARTRNNLGAETRLRYAPSTRFYLEDERQGLPWVTRLPFPVHALERVETYDWIGRSRAVTRYAYHHGYFDGHEREFRGFGRVTQWDTEERRDDTDFPAAANWDEASWTPPVRTETWFHTGAFVETGAVSRHYSHEYWTEPPLRPPQRDADRQAMWLTDSTLPPGLDADELREAHRALKGSVLRVEVYADDDTERAAHPYTVTEQSFAVRTLQRRGTNRHAVFQAHPREKLAFHYERRPDDPRVTHELDLEVDPYGNVLRQVTVGYPRRPGHPEPEPDLAVAFRGMLAYDQSRLHVAATANRFTADTLTDPALHPDVHRTPLPAETIAAELTGLAPEAHRPGVTNRFRFDELDGLWATAWDGAHDAPYEELPAADVDGVGALPATLTRRIVERTCTLYRRDDLTALLAPGELEPLALPGDSYRLALTPGLLARLFGARVDAAILAEGGYVQLAGSDGRWSPTGRTFYSPGDADPPAAERAEARAHFYQPRRLVDPLGGVTRMAWDAFDLLAAAVTDAVGNVTAAANDYRVLQPFRVTDPNGNRAEVAFDALGLVTGHAVRGKATENLGDSLDAFLPDLDEAAVLAHLADPLNDPGTVLGQATSRLLYDLFAYHRTRDQPQPAPAVVCTLARETHVSDLAPGDSPLFRHIFSYSDGFAREAQRKAQAEAGPLLDGGPAVAPRWIGSGWTLYDNKGNPVRRYEPFFSASHGFELARQQGVSSVLFYDPAQRLVATLHPNDTWEKVVFDAWRQETWDVNDTVLIADPRQDGDAGDLFHRFLGGSPDAFTSWHSRRIGGAFGDTAEQRAAEQDAAQKAAAHAGTPAVVHFDALGRPCLAVADNGAAGRYPSRTAFDTEGKPLAVFDPRGRRVVEHCLREPLPGGGFRYLAGIDLAGATLYQNGMDGGERRTLDNVAGRPLRSWDALGRAFHTLHDPLQRPTHLYVSVGGAPQVLLERLVYGEGLADRNLGGRLFRRYDGAGVAVHERHDFKGNLLLSARQLAREVRLAVDWSDLAPLTAAADLDAAAAPQLLPAERYQAATRYDALDRPIQTVTPHRAGMRPSVLQPVYNEAALLERLDVWLRPAATPAGLLAPATADLHAVTDVDYNARGQRTRLALGNGTVTTHDYDPQTFRLARLATLRPDTFAAGQRQLQDLAYTYDPAGNVTRLRDAADLQNVVYFRNRRVDPSSDYTYDALYRLVRATGREHLGQSGGALAAPRQVTHDDSFRAGLLHPGDGNAVGRYSESYAYDAAGNLLAMTHQVASGAWTRRYRYAEPSRIDDAETGDRLSATSLPGDPEAGPYTGLYEHDAHGSMTRMPHLAALAWDPQDRLRSTRRQVVVAGEAETTFYAYDAEGQRLRKVTDRPAGTHRTERLYLGPLEIYRELDAGEAVTLERETLRLLLGADRVALIETRTAGTDAGLAQSVRFQYSNHLGSAALELDGDAAVVSYEEYFPFGATAYRAVRGLLETPKRYRYTGKERDEESDLYYHGARYYAPWLGRWTAADPIGISDSTSLYGYSRNNPVVLSDPQGTQPTAREEAEQTSLPEEHPETMSSMPPPADATSSEPSAVSLSTPPPNASTLDVVRRSGFAQGLGGLTAGTIQGIVPGLSLVNPPPPSRTFEFFRGAGEFAWGVAQLFGGAGGEVLGGGLDLTGVGAPAGIAINVGAAAVMVHGAVNVTAGAATMGNALAMSSSGNTGGGGSSASSSERPSSASGGPQPSSPSTGGGSGQSFPNQLPGTLGEELATARRLGVRPVQPTDPGFSQVANAGRIKWVITETGELRVIPHTVGRTEISHTVLTGGRPVLAAGEADIAVGGGRAVGLDISPRSGHFLQGADAATNARVLELGREAFRRFGIQFLP
jgi:RHS repeat-associated protein